MKVNATLKIKNTISKDTMVKILLEEGNIISCSKENDEYVISIYEKITSTKISHEELMEKIKKQIGESPYPYVSPPVTPYKAAKYPYVTWNDHTNLMKQDYDGGFYYYK